MSLEAYTNNYDKTVESKTVYRGNSFDSLTAFSPIKEIIGNGREEENGCGRSRDSHVLHESSLEAGTVVDNEKRRHCSTTSDDPHNDEDPLLVEESFRRKLNFERKFLHDHSKRHSSVPSFFNGKRILCENVSVDNGDCNATSVSSKRPLVRKWHSSPQFGIGKIVHPPCYWLTCTYNLAAANDFLVVTVRQTGAVPPQYDNHAVSKVSASLYIEPGYKCYDIILMKSLNDCSCRSLTVNFKVEDFNELVKKTMCLKLYLHKNSYLRECVAEWKIPLADCSQMQKIACKKFFSDCQG